MNRVDEIFAAMLAFAKQAAVAVKTIDYQQILSDPRQIAIVVSTLLILLLLIVWSVLSGKKANRSPAETLEKTASVAFSSKAEETDNTAEGTASAQSGTIIQANPDYHAAFVVKDKAAKQQQDESLSSAPEDSILHRHYLANEEAKEAALHEPYPSDSVLKRHYDSAHKLEVEKTAPMVEKVADPQPAPLPADEIPQDSILHRHYLANEDAKEAALHEPYPTDSVLKRHYDSSHKLVVEKQTSPEADMVADTQVMPQMTGEIPQDSILHRHYLANEEAKEAALHEPYPTDSVLKRHYDSSHKLVLETANQLAQVGGMPIPEDSVLKRHFIGQLRAEIESSLSPRPSDSVLRRHHESLVEFELAKRLNV